MKKLKNSTYVDGISAVTYAALTALNMLVAIAVRDGATFVYVKYTKKNTKMKTKDTKMNYSDLEK